MKSKNSTGFNNGVIGQRQEKKPEKVLNQTLAISVGGGSRCGNQVSCLSIANCIINDAMTQMAILNLVNTNLALPSGGMLTALCEAVQDCVGDAIAGFDYSDSINSWIQENPLTNATYISYDNSIVNQLTATNMQDAIDELAVNATQREFETSTIIDVSGSVITLLNAPVSDAQLWLHRNGLRLEPTEDYTRVGNAITLVIPPFFNDKFFASYQY